MSTLNVLDLFCGAGGLSYGFESAGFNVLLGIDNDAKALETFELIGSESAQYRALGNAIPPVMFWYVAHAVSEQFPREDRTSDLPCTSPQNPL